MGSNYPVHVTCVFATHNNNEPTMPRFGRVNKRYTYSIHGTASGYRLIGDVKRRLQWIKKHADLHDSLPGNLFTEVQMIFRSFGYTEKLIYIFVAPNKLPSGEDVVEFEAKGEKINPEPVESVDMQSVDIKEIPKSKKSRRLKEKDS